MHSSLPQDILKTLTNIGGKKDEYSVLLGLLLISFGPLLIELKFSALPIFLALIIDKVFFLSPVTALSCSNGTPLKTTYE